MEPLATRIENAAEQTAAAAQETASTTAEAVTPVAEAAAEKTEEAVADIGETAAAAVTETLATTSEPPAADTAAAPMDPKLLGAAIAAIVVIVLVIAALARRKKGGKAPSAKPTGSNGSMVEIYVGNLSYDMNDAQLRREFERFGVVKSARVITNRSNNKSKGYGFVEMPHRKEALIAIKALDNSEVMARRIRVNEARANTKPPEDR